MQTKFLLGTLKITPAARRLLGRLPYDLLAMHGLCEHGYITKAERKANERGLRTLGRIVSRYKSDPTNPNAPLILVVTEATWSETNVSVESLVT